MRLIDADELLNFFDSPSAGTNEVIRDLVSKYTNTVIGSMYEDDAIKIGAIL